MIATTCRGIGVIGVNGSASGTSRRCAQSDVAAPAVCDIDPARAEKAGSQQKLPAFTDPAAMYASGEVDAVVIATPAGTHGQLTRDALDAGMHVYCEKPIAPTSDEGYALARHAARRNARCRSAFSSGSTRGTPRRVKRSPNSVELARVNLTATNWSPRPGVLRHEPLARDLGMAGGGVLMNQAVHQLDAIIAAAGCHRVCRRRCATPRTGARSRTTRR